MSSPMANAALDLLFSEGESLAPGFIKFVNVETVAGKHRIALTVLPPTARAALVQDYAQSRDKVAFLTPMLDQKGRALLPTLTVESLGWLATIAVSMCVSRSVVAAIREANDQCCPKGA